MKIFGSGYWRYLVLPIRFETRGISLSMVGILFFSLILAPSCATQRISGNEFVHETKGYTFVLPGVDWEVDEEAWRNERDFGYVLVRERSKPKFRRYNGNQSGSEPNDFVVRSLPEEEVEKLLLDMDVGFRHKTQMSEPVIYRKT